MVQMRFKTMQNDRNRRPSDLYFLNSISYVEVAFYSESS
jgi:hypothetical protein